jgi:gliding motility-associated-like protein
MRKRGKQVRWLLGVVVAQCIGSPEAAWAQTPITFRIATSPACVGETVRLILTNTVDPTAPVGLPGDSLYWNFGSAASMPRARTSASVSEYGVSYVSAGVFPFGVELRRQGRFMQGWYGPLFIQAGPLVQLGPDTTVCAPIAVRLAPRNALPAGSTLRWPDGSTGPFFLATAPGTYWLEVTSPGLLCSSRVPRVIRAGTNCGPVSGSGNPNGPGGAGGSGGGNGPGGSSNTNEPATGFIPNIITANGDGHNDYFVLDGLVAAEWRLQVFNRWGREVFQQAQYDNGWAAQGQGPGLYYYLLRHGPSGQQRRGWLQVLK